MAKATTRIKHGKTRELRPGEPGFRDKSHLETVEVGEDAPKGLDEETERIATDDGEDYEPAYDPDDPESFEGEDAARDSKLMAPDNPNRPSSVPGEDSWKVSHGGAFGRDTGSIMSSEEAAEADKARREAERPKRATAAREVKEGSGKKASKRSGGKSGQSTGQSAHGED
jgi:hypothetical protein